MKKKILSMVLTLCILAAFVPMTVQAYNGTQYGDLYYEINEDNTVTIIECDKSAMSIVIPSEIDGKSVTSIGGAAFYGCSSIISIVIPNSVTSIGGEAFNNCSSLTSITLPNRVTSIDSGVFQGCTSLTSVTIPHSVTVISTAFEDCNALEDVYYYGTKADWDGIGGPKYYNTSLMNANIHFIEPYFTLAKMSQVAEITNTDSAEHTAAIIIPQYENGILKGVVSENVTFAAGEKKTYNLSGDYKVFVWDSLSGMYPLDK